MGENKEKKTITLSLTTGICLIVIVMLSIVILTTVYFFKINEIKNNNANTNTIENTDNTPIGLKPPADDNKSEYSIEEVKKSFQNYINLTDAIEGSPATVVKALGFNINEGKKITIEEVQYIITEIKYSDFKDYILNCLSEKLFEEKFEKHFGVDCFKDANGVLYVADVGATALKTEIVNIEEKSKNTYIATICNILQDDSKENESMVEFTTNTYNGKCIIDIVK